MKRLALGFLALTLVSAAPAFAHEKDDGPSISIKSCCEKPARWADRQDPDEIRTAIHTEDGGVALVLTGDVVALQLSDRAMKKVRRELKEETEDEEDNALAQAFKSAVIGGVRAMLNHSVECRIRDLRSVDYRGGQLVLIANSGDRVFEGIEVDDQQVLENFSERDAREFIAEFRRLKQRRSL